MDQAYGSILVGFMVDVGYLAGIPLAVATATGLIVSIFQAITQIQDQTLGQTFKIAAIATVLLLFGTVLSAPLMTSTRMIFEEFGTLAR